MKKICIVFLIFVQGLFAYSPSPFIAQKAESLSKNINAYIERLSGKRKITILQVFSSQLPMLQTRLIPTGDVERMYLLEFIRRNLPGAKNIDTPGLIDDDGLGYTWTHAPDGFDIFYFPSPVPAFGSVASLEKYPTLLNGSYFSRREGGIYPSGLLYANNQVYSEFISDDKQLTHMFCQKKDGRFIFLRNDEYVSEEDIMSRCDIAFQSGPMMYQKNDGIITENLLPRTYIGSPHVRTVMVVFQKENGEQDMWFLTVYSRMTLAQVRDIVLAETRFYGEYDDVFIFNLDGGSSVAYKSKKFPELTFGTNKRLPIIFALK